jgi:hypothetical protein
MVERGLKCGALGFRPVGDARIELPRQVLAGMGHKGEGNPIPHVHSW